MNKIIGIAGKKRAGKDSLAMMLSLRFENSITYSFAKPLKQEVARAMGTTVEYIDCHKDNFRLILQGWGTDYRRKLYGNDFWVHKMDRACEMFGNYNVLIIPDIRFKNEFDWVKAHGGIMIRVERDNLPFDDHKSETELDHEQFDYVIKNNLTFEDLINESKKIK